MGRRRSSIGLDGRRIVAIAVLLASPSPAHAADDLLQWEAQELKSSEVADAPAATAAAFGAALAVFEGTALVAAPDLAVAGAGPGKVFVFEHADTKWREGPPVTSPPGSSGRFGSSLALSHDFIAVGSSSPLGASATPIWMVPRARPDQARSLAILPGTTPSPQFGAALALEADTLLVGDPGANGGAGQVVVYGREDDEWRPQQALPDSATALDLLDSYFGYSLALGGDRALVGAPFSEGGSVYGFQRMEPGAPFVLSAKHPPRPSDSVTFGWAVAMDAVSGALVVTDNAFETDSGIAYLYEPTANGWFSASAPLLSGPLDANRDYEGFGQAAVFAHGTLLIGAPGKQLGSGKGAVLRFLQGGTSTPISETIPQLGGLLAGTRGGLVLATSAQNQVYAFALAGGVSCDAAGDCSSLLCVDGVCCESACDGQCESCAAAETNAAAGTCAPVAHGTDPAGECAELDERCSSRTCDGAGACDALPSDSVCEPAGCDADGNLVISAALCDGSGRCLPGESKPCEPGFSCFEGKCRAEASAKPVTEPVLDCASSGDCDKAAGFYCLEGRCVSGSQCATQQNIAYDAHGAATSCAPSLCAAGACRFQCAASKTDCVDGYWCDPEAHRCVAQTALSRARDDTSVACRLGHPATGAHALGGLLCLAMTWGLRRASATRARKELCVTRSRKRQHIP